MQFLSKSASGFGSGIFLAGLVMCWGIARPAGASTLGLDITAVDAYFCEATDTPGCVLGYQFSVLSPVVLTDLGFLDRSSDGLLSSHDVGLWSTGGTLLASTTITNASSVVASASAGDRWLFESVSPVLLAVGDYVIGAWLPPDASDDRVRGGGSTIAAAEISFSGNRYLLGVGSLVMPTLVLGGADDGFLGPGFQFTVAPEPAMGLPVAAILAGALWWRRRRGSSRSTGI
jgi:hypothetical protein